MDETGQLLSFLILYISMEVRMSKQENTTFASQKWHEPIP